MSPLRYRDEDDSIGSSLAGLALGALAGFAVGVLVSQKVGGMAGLTARLKERLPERFRGARALGGGDVDVADEEEGDELEDQYESDDAYESDEEGDEEMDASAELEERVLEAFRNDPILSERAVDIGAVGDGIIELSGWVDEEDEVDHAVTVARGVPGVDTVVNRLAVGEEEEMLEDNRRRFEAGDDALTEARWEGNQQGTGRRRQGTSAEPDRHADQRTELRDKALDEQHAVRDAADDMEGIAERRRQNKNAEIKGDRTGGSPVAPTGVPKADHVVNPEAAPDSQRNP